MAYAARSPSPCGGVIYVTNASSETKHPADRPAIDEIEVTEAMKEAGTGVLSEYGDSEFIDRRWLAHAVYIAMVRASQREVAGPLSDSQSRTASSLRNQSTSDDSK